jgi:hypothetical protein
MSPVESEASQPRIRRSRLPHTNHADCVARDAETPTPGLPRYLVNEATVEKGHVMKENQQGVRGS